YAQVADVLPQLEYADAHFVLKGVGWERLNGDRLGNRVKRFKVFLPVCPEKSRIFGYFVFDHLPWDSRDFYFSFGKGKEGSLVDFISHPSFAVNVYHLGDDVSDVEIFLPGIIRFEFFQDRIELSPRFIEIKWCLI